MTTSATVYAASSTPVVERVAVTHGNPHDQLNLHNRKREREREGADRLSADVVAMASRSGRHDTAGAVRRRHGLRRTQTAGGIGRFYPVRNVPPGMSTEITQTSR